MAELNTLMEIADLDGCLCKRGIECQYHGMMRETRERQDAFLARDRYEWEHKLGPYEEGGR